MPATRKSNQSKARTYNNQHRFEHWYRDNQVYFITAKTNHATPVFTTEHACQIFWQAFDRATNNNTFTPWVTALLNNHYHTLGHLQTGARLPRMMQTLHGTIAKQINDALEAGDLKLPRQSHQHPNQSHQQPNQRLLPFWGHNGKKTYFDGCIRDETQATRAFYYTQNQAVRAKLVKHWQDHPHTRVHIDLEQALPQATKLNAFLRGVPYKRYLNKQGGGT